MYTYFTLRISKDKISKVHSKHYRGDVITSTVRGKYCFWPAVKSAKPCIIFQLPWRCLIIQEYNFAPARANGEISHIFRNSCYRRISLKFNCLVNWYFSVINIRRLHNCCNIFLCVWKQLQGMLALTSCSMDDE